MYEIERSGKRRKGINLFDLPVTPKPELMLRGDVEQALFTALPKDVEVRYSTVPTKIDQDSDGVDVTLHDLVAEADTTEHFDLVVGADGDAFYGAVVGVRPARALSASAQLHDRGF